VSGRTGEINPDRLRKKKQNGERTPTCVGQRKEKTLNNKGGDLNTRQSGLARGSVQKKSTKGEKTGGVPSGEQSIAGRSTAECEKES